MFDMCGKDFIVFLAAMFIFHILFIEDIYIFNSRNP